MKFKTKLWRRSEQSYATTVPEVVCSFLDLKKTYYIEWANEKGKWRVNFLDHGKKSPLSTKLWKRSQASYATTVPLQVLLHIDESKEYIVEWEHKNGWVLEIVEAAK